MNTQQKPAGQPGTGHSCEDSEMNVGVVVPLIAGIGGVLLGGLVTFSNDRLKWRRERAARWDERRLSAFVDYATAVKREVHVCNRMAKAMKLGTMDEDEAALDSVEGVRQLNAAEERRADAFEGLLLLADSKTIDAARVWHQSVWRLRKAVTGKLVDQDTFMTLFNATGVARDDFHLTARRSLSVNSEFARALAFDPRVVDST